MARRWALGQLDRWHWAERRLLGGIEVIGEKIKDEASE